MSTAKERKVKEAVEKVIEHLNLNDNPNDIYDLQNSLGKGSYGDVFKALNKLNNEIHAVKVIKVESVKIEDVFKEIEILAKCQSPYIGILI